MRDILVSTAEDVRGTRRNPQRHKETWWWHDEVAKAVMLKIWQKSKTSQDKEIYCKV